MPSARLGREHPPGIPWTPPGQAQANAYSNWSYPQSFPCTYLQLAEMISSNVVDPASTSTGHSTSVSYPMASFGRPAVAHFGRAVAPSTSSFTPTAEFRHPGQGVSFSRPSLVQPLSTVTTNPAPAVTSPPPPAKPAPQVAPPFNKESNLSTSRVFATRLVEAPVRPTPALGVNLARLTSVSRLSSTQIIAPSQPRSHILQPGGNRSMATVQHSRPDPSIKESSAPLPKPSPSRSAPPVAKKTVEVTTPPPQNGSLKRRLGMGPRTAGGYSNKKFKPPTK